MWRNDIKCKYIFLFPLKNLECKGLKNKYRAHDGVSEFSVYEVTWFMKKTDKRKTLHYKSNQVSVPLEDLLYLGIIHETHTDTFIRSVDDVTVIAGQTSWMTRHW